MQRTSLYLAVLLCLTSCTSSEAPFPGKPVAFDRDEICVSPGQSPVCVAKTLQACRSPVGLSAPCEMIGVKAPGRELNVLARDAQTPGPEPWKLTWDELSALELSCGYTIIGVEEVQPTRFNADPPLPDALKGTHELILVDNICYGAVAVMSLFMSRKDTGWVLTSFDDSYLEDGKPGLSSCDVPKALTDQYDLCPMRAAGISKRPVQLPDIMPVAPEWGLKPLSAEEKAKTCKGTAGEKIANTYAVQCREVSPATRPPCHPLNPCDMIIDEIARGCGMLTGTDKPAYCGS